MKMGKGRSGGWILLGAVLLSAGWARPQNLPAGATLDDPLNSARRELVEKSRNYQVRLESELPALESSLQKRREFVERLRPLLEKGYIARVEFEKAEAERAAAEQVLADRRAELLTVGQIVVEAEAELAAALREQDSRIATRAVEAVVRFRGSGAWTLAETVTLANFFWSRFGRELPISAYGQTPTHDALGFDHRGQIDVAIHPETPEGRALMNFLKERAISFVGFSGAVKGAATGAHIHVGRPSPRLY